MANNRNKYIKKGTELKLSYGNRTNRYLAVWYGFSLLDNTYDSYYFRIVIDEKVAKNAELVNGVILCHITAEDRKNKYITYNGYIISTELITTPFRIKRNEINLQLISFLRSHLYQNWIKEHSSKKKSIKFSISIPSDLSFELHVMKRYVDIFTGLLSSYKRSDEDDIKLLKSNKLSGPKRVVVTCEFGWKKIIIEQIRLGRIVVDILKQIKANPSKVLKEVYMKKLESDSSSPDYLQLRFKIKKYLKRLFLSPSLQNLI